MVRWLWGWLVVVLCLSSGVMAAKGEVPPQEQIKADPLAIWRVMGRTDQESSSDCIGQTDSLSCTIDTVTACFLRGDLHYCHQAIQNFPDIKFHWGSGKRPFSPTPYRIDSVRQLQKPEMMRPLSPLALQLSPLQAEKGDWVIEYYHEILDDSPIIMVLRQNGSEWRLITWFVRYDLGWSRHKEPRPKIPWQRMAGWDALSSSTCIGRGDTPICAMETHMACEIRRKGDERCNSLEEIREVLQESLRKGLHSDKNPFLTMNYKILEIKKGTQKPSKYGDSIKYDMTVFEVGCDFFGNVCSHSMYYRDTYNYEIFQKSGEWYVFWKHRNLSGIPFWNPFGRPHLD